MKKKVILFMMIGLLICVNSLYADGDLIVDGSAGIGIEETENPLARLHVVESGPGANIQNAAVFQSKRDDFQYVEQGQGVSLEFRIRSLAPQYQLWRKGIIKYVISDPNANFGDLVLGTTSPYGVHYDLMTLHGMTGNVGIGTASPQSKLAVSGLPDSPPVAGTSYIVCIDPDGNFWVDKVGDMNCNASN